MYWHIQCYILMICLAEMLKTTPTYSTISFIINCESGITCTHVTTNGVIAVRIFSANVWIHFTFIYVIFTLSAVPEFITQAFTSCSITGLTLVDSMVGGTLTRNGTVNSIVISGTFWSQWIRSMYNQMKALEYNKKTYLIFLHYAFFFGCFSVLLCCYSLCIIQKVTLNQGWKTHITRHTFIKDRCLILIKIYQQIDSNKVRTMLIT